ncbi:nucleoside hydrolase-like domain-containing protein [Leptothoe sp. PORK10 BA2]|uniref:nucleoside hydrolase-like domain-containing protein n=1 Tax=Leptothoe sp. PORK10 BA2 TaxID=3110254 RepID=UPI002B21C7EB|nr:nucleoside hydrolase-like domain-containing protein [Leptothoe sp. PORK10 BA2]MEA5466341.1 nucleoside hydrolase-like domain-containing protein [Leptothoe sp. PORK10 BA2]
MDRRVFLRNSLLGCAAGLWSNNFLQSRAIASTGSIIPVNQRPRVVVISDIQAGAGDPDDRQSMAHLMMYANEVEISGIWPDDLNTGGLATRIVLDRYQEDYNNPAYKFRSLGYPTPDALRTKLFTSHNQAISAIKAEASRNDPRPIYVLVWGGTHRVPQFLEQLTSSERGKIRLISIGTYLLDNALANGDGRRYNWNAWGEARNDIWRRFPDVWWLEMDWTWMGMAFNTDYRIANECVVLNNQLAQYAGKLGAHIKEVLPQYFRALDTNSLLYVLDPANNLNDPTRGSWAGKYHRPFADRPNYYIGIDGGNTWNYANPASTWNNATKVFIARINTAISQRPAWHRAFTQKFMQLYGHTPLTVVPPPSGGGTGTGGTGTGQTQQGPTANAGADQTVTDTNGDGFERVVLDGTGSRNGNGPIVSYVWQEGSKILATTNGGSISVNLAVGVHSITLVVKDSNGAIASDSVTITVRAGASTPQPTTGTLYRAINLNGGAVSVDGVAFEGKNAANYSTVGRSHVTSTVPNPPVAAAKKAMLQSFIWGRSVSVTMNSIPTGNYRVYLWVMEDNSTVTFSVKVNGRSVISNGRSGSAGTWQRLDLGAVTISNGQLVVQGDLSVDALNMCAIEVRRN